MADILLHEISSNLIDSVERVEDLEITGQTVDVENGRTVTITLNGKTYTTTVLNSLFSAIIPASDIMLFTDETTYSVVATVTNLAGETDSDSEDVSTGEFKMGVQKTHAVNVETTTNLRFVSDVEVDTIRGRITELEQRTFQQTTTPTVGVNDGDIWLDTNTDTLKVYREYPLGSGNFRWEPLLYKWDDTVDGGIW